MELSARKKQILKRVIEDYIASAEPVGSKAIAQEMGGSVSSATVRNELAELSDLGYLEQPHTSAGRVPSPKGYRLYVNELMEHKTVTSEEAEKITSALGGRMQQIDQVSVHLRGGDAGEVGVEQVADLAQMLLLHQ